MTAVNEHVTADAGQRIEVLDLIRGFTLGGIFFANVLWFSGFLELPNSSRAQMLSTSSDQVVLLLIRLLVHAKFYHIFAFLFGLGFALQLQKNTVSINKLFTRRLALLFIFGVLHSLIWWGDIMRYYALLGFSLLLFRQLTNRQLLACIAVFSLLPVLSEHIQAIWLNGGIPFSFVDIPSRQRLSFMLQASLLEQFHLNLRQIGDHFLNNVASGRILKILAMFLAGLVVGRMGILAKPQAHAGLIRSVIWVSFWVGILGNLLSVSFYYEKWGMSLRTVELLRDWIGLVSVPALSLFYVSWLLGMSLAPRRESRLFRSLRLLIPAGRMALTNYMLQSIIAGLIFRPGLGGLYGQLSVSHCAALVLLIFSAQVAFSHWWLARFRFGPLEWLWRSGTYKQWQRLRV